MMSYIKVSKAEVFSIVAVLALTLSFIKEEDIIHIMMESLETVTTTNCYSIHIGINEY